MSKHSIFGSIDASVRGISHAATKAVQQTTKPLPAPQQPTPQMPVPDQHPTQSRASKLGYRIVELSKRDVSQIRQQVETERAVTYVREVAKTHVEAGTKIVLKAVGSLLPTRAQIQAIQADQLREAIAHLQKNDVNAIWRRNEREYLKHKALQAKALR